MRPHLLFDLLAWCTAVAVGLTVWRWRLRDTVTQLKTRLDGAYFPHLSLGAIAGAWGFGSLNLWLSGLPAPGHSILGALVGAIASVELYKQRRGLRGSTGVMFAAPLAAAMVVGRVGCFRAGLADQTHGTPSALPWAVDFGDGIARHPVQLYEAASMALVLAALLWALARRSPRALGHGFYYVVGAYGAQRFAWEFLKPYATLLGPFNLFHLLAAALVLYAWAMARSTPLVHA